MTIKTDKIRNFAGEKGAFGQSIYIKEIFPGYLEGWTDNGTKKAKHTYKSFAKAEDNVLVGGSDRIKEFTKELEQKLGSEWREQIWEEGKPSFYKMKEKLDAAFFKANPKMFDMVVVTESPVTLPEWDKDLKQNIPTETNEFILTVRVSKLKDLVNGLIEDAIPMEAGKDGTLYPVRGWEDSFKDKLKGHFFKLKAVASGKKIGDQNQYDVYEFTYKEAKPFDINAEKDPFSLEDIPF